MDTLVSDQGLRPIARCDALGVPPYSESDRVLVRPYLTASHRAALDRIDGWMKAAGMTTRLDALGNLVGRYEAATPGAKTLLIGSHIDTVPDAGRYDGALGVMLGIECVEAFHRQGRRLPFAIEVIAFGDEEGSRFPSSMLCSRSLAHDVEPRALEVTDKEGVSIAQALAAFGLDPAAAASTARDPAEVLAYVEAHIEQGPLLEAENLPIGVVTGVAAQLRIKAAFTGRAGHAGTTPMHLRADAIAAAAAAVLAVETICKDGPTDLVGTVGRIAAATSAYNVIAGQAEIGIDLRAATVAVRDEAAAAVRQALEKIAAARNVELSFEIVQDLPGKACDPRLMALFDAAVADVGVRPFRLISGAGHDAMAVADLAPVGMLFIRCESGVSHNAAEKVAAGDVALAAGAMTAFVERLAKEGL